MNTAQQNIGLLRVQRLRSLGFKKPVGSLYVGRPGKWGNPFKVQGDRIFILVISENKERMWVDFCRGDIKKCLRLYRWVVSTITDGEPYGVPVDNLHLMKYWLQHFRKLNVRDLRDKKLMCWCNLAQPCHVDVLIELANK